MNIIKVTNKTETDIIIGSMTYQPNIEVILFNSNDLSTYSNSLEVLTKYFDVYKNLSIIGDISVDVDGVILLHSQQWDYIQDNLTPMNKLHKVGFQDTSPFFFNMRTNDWTVINPLDGKEYIITMVPKTSA